MSVFKKIKAGNKFEAERMADAKPQINSWVMKGKKLGVDGNQVISDFIKYASEQNKIYNPALFGTGIRNMTV